MNHGTVRLGLSFFKWVLDVVEANDSNNASRPLTPE